MTFSLNAGGIVIYRNAVRFQISLPVMKVFAIEIWSWPKWPQILQVLRRTLNFSA